MNDLYCAAASAQQNLQIPVGAQFVCPQCGKSLVSPPVQRHGVTANMLMVCGGLVLAGVALFATGALIGTKSPAPAAPAVNKAVADTQPPIERGDKEGQPPSSAAVTSPSAAAPSGPAQIAAAGATSPAQAAVPQSTPGADHIGGGQPLAQSAPSQPASTPPALHLAMIQTPAKPAPTRQPPQASSQPAAPMPSAAQIQAAQAASRAQAQALSARQVRAVEARRAQAAQLAAQQQQRATALQAQELRRRTELQKAQAEEEALARQQDEAARVAQAQAQAAAAAKQHQQEEAKRLAALPPAPRGPSRRFSPVPVAGGAPAYPQAYESEGRTGRVTVSCMIGESGTPSGCHVVTAQGGEGFSNAALGWLRSGVRFAPVLRDGEAKAEEHSWTMSFQP